jgi:hypothetical protein
MAGGVTGPTENHRPHREPPAPQKRIAARGIVCRAGDTTRRKKSRWDGRWGHRPHKTEPPWMAGGVTGPTKQNRRGWPVRSPAPQSHLPHKTEPPWDGRWGHRPHRVTGPTESPAPQRTTGPTKCRSQSAEYLKLSIMLILENEVRPPLWWQ